VIEYPETSISERVLPPNTRSRWRSWLAAIVLSAVILGAVVSFALLRAHRNYKAQLLASAGILQTGRMETDVPVDSVTDPAIAPRNAAGYYSAVLNSWAARRIPYLRNRKLNPYADEPLPNPVEIHLMLAGAAARDCDFYSSESPGLIFYLYPGTKPWRFEPASDPYAARPYIGVMRLVAQGVLNVGKRREKAGVRAEAERDYRAVVRFGWHLRQKPGSILDLQLGLELQQKGMHYLDTLYSQTRESGKRRAVWKYGDSLKRLAEAVERKYTQLGNPEAAMEILRRDPEPVWRIQAAAALALARDVERYGWLERRDVGVALAASRTDPNETVREAVGLLSMPPKQAASPPAPAEAAR
jgi:hypothetical protein